MSHNATNKITCIAEIKKKSIENHKKVAYAHLTQLCSDSKILVSLFYNSGSGPEYQLILKVWFLPEPYWVLKVLVPVRPEQDLDT